MRCDLRKGISFRSRNICPFPELGKTGAAEVIEAAGFDANIRGETLSIPEFVRIANEIVKRRNR